MASLQTQFWTIQHPMNKHPSSCWTRTAILKIVAGSAGIRGSTRLKKAQDHIVVHEGKGDLTHRWVASIKDCDDSESP
ncbi:hypothetical protein [Bradyrhizobium lablabi]|uniref:hypothetical protein n=1 Tax=Bradyrhizobium lablabi TaxID=722472 RepID=UPI001BA79A0F|nr:hypothetical protein [Bradyrhizobium lablabi]MBR0693263.1 hypothetical protein [Bradyrhizobium lablabi]